MEDKKEFIRLYCFGCGALLQNDHPHQAGYVPKHLETDAHYLCQRCFRLQHYGEVKEDGVKFTDYATVVEHARKERALVIYVADLFAFESSLIPPLLERLKECRVVIIASKRDVLPASIKDAKLKEFIRDRFREYGIRPLDIIVSSAKKNYNIDEILFRCSNLRKGKNVYVFGASSVGKSSLVNALLKIYDNRTNRLISTSPYPGTTLDVISMPIDEATCIYDTPGILPEGSILAHIDRKLVKYIMPRKEIKPRVYQLREKQSLLIENLCKIDFVEGGRTNITVYLSNDLEILRSKMENSEKVFDNMIRNRQFKKIDRSIRSHEDLETHEFTLPQEAADIVVSGLLWIRGNGKGQKLRISAPRGVAVFIRECKI